MKKYIGLITALLPLMASAQLVMTGSYYVVMTGGTQANPTSLVLTNPATTGITNTGSGWIVSENEFNQVDWNIGTNTGTYVVPFGDGAGNYLPLSCNITAAGVGSGTVKFATYHGGSWNNTAYQPSDVTNMGDFNLADDSKGAADRFWILDAGGYTTKPTSTILFTYVRSGGANEIASPNYITEANLLAQRFNSSLTKWNDWMGTTGTDVTSGNTGTVSSGSVPATGFYRSWTLFSDSNITTSVQAVSMSSSITMYPNPGNGNFTVSGLTQGQVIEMYDYLGQLLNRSVVDNSTMHFDISTKANGVYLMRIENRDGSGAIEKKIVKTN